ncbi:MAG: nitroreductase family protein [Candidatus Hodarchaeales archaeon]|jgi:nitroreductase
MMKNLLESVNTTFTENFFELVKARRSIRKYQNVKIPDIDIERMLEAARLAPSAENSQPWQFLVIRDSATKNYLAQKAGNQAFIAKANVVVLILSKKSASCCSKSSWYLFDPMIAAEHLVLAATALGYGTCWVGLLETRPSEAIQEIKDVLNIPSDVYTISLITIGVPAETPSPRPRKDLQDLTFREKYGTQWNLTFPRSEKEHLQCGRVTI